MIEVRPRIAYPSRMPLYQTRCTLCRAVGQIHRVVEERNNVPPCTVCGGKREREISAPAVRGEIAPYESPVTGKMITSRTQMREDLAKSGCVINEPGLKREIEKRKVVLQNEAAEKVVAKVDDVVGSLAASGRI